jgi:hypothetical protein
MSQDKYIQRVAELVFDQKLDELLDLTEGNKKTKEKLKAYLRRVGSEAKGLGTAHMKQGETNKSPSYLLRRGRAEAQKGVITQEPMPGPITAIQYKKRKDESNLDELRLPKGGIPRDPKSGRVKKGAGKELAATAFRIGATGKRPKSAPIVGKDGVVDFGTKASRETDEPVTPEERSQAGKVARKHGGKHGLKRPPREDSSHVYGRLIDLLVEAIAYSKKTIFGKAARKTAADTLRDVKKRMITSGLATTPRGAAQLTKLFSAENHPQRPKREDSSINWQERIVDILLEARNKAFHKILGDVPPPPDNPKRTGKKIGSGADSWARTMRYKEIAAKTGRTFGVKPPKKTMADVKAKYKNPYDGEDSGSSGGRPSKPYNYRDGGDHGSLTAAERNPGLMRGRG